MQLSWSEGTLGENQSGQAKKLAYTVSAEYMHTGIPITSCKPHVTYQVDAQYIADAHSVICGPMEANDKEGRLAFVRKDGAILELYQEA